MSPINHYRLIVTYSSGGRERQIDFIMCRRSHLKEVTNCKVINGDSVTEQHKVLAMGWEINICKKRRAGQRTPMIKWWRLKEEERKTLFKEKVLQERRLPDSVQEWWEETSKVILEAGQEVLGSGLVDRKETTRGQRIMVVERGSEGGDES